MKRYLPLLLLLVLVAGCKSPESYNLLDKTERWKGDVPLPSDSGIILLEGEFMSWRYQPGIFTSFRNFELTAEMRTAEGAQAAIWFHTGKHDPGSGYEVRIDNSAPGDWDRLLKTGSLASIRNICYNMVANDTWFTMKIRVEENHITVTVNGYPVVDYIEPEIPFRPAHMENCRLSSGTFALQTLSGNSRIEIRNLEVKPLPKGEVLVNEDPAFVKQLTQLHSRNLPVVDYHVHIKGDLTMEDALEKSARLGINYGIAANCGLKFPIENDEQLRAYLNSIEGLPIFKAMQAEGREWVDMFSPDLVSRFDYAFTDAMTWTNKNGTRMRLWIPEETEVGDPEDFMEQLVAQIEKVVEEPISVYVNPTYLPAEIADRYEELWTDERIDRVIMALKKNHVALEINSKSQLPGKRFIQRAKEEGVRFAMGTNNGNAENLGRLDWAIEMVEEFQLQPTDMFLPGSLVDQD